MRYLAEGPGLVNCYAEEGDAVVLTDSEGATVAGPVFLDSDGRARFVYRGPRREVHWALVRPDGRLGWWSDQQLYVYDRGGVVVEMTLGEPGSDLTVEDRRWLDEHSLPRLLGDAID